MLPAETQPAGYKAGLRRPRSSETRASGDPRLARAVGRHRPERRGSRHPARPPRPDSLGHHPHRRIAHRSGRGHAPCRPPRAAGPATWPAHPPRIRDPPRPYPARTDHEPAGANTRRKENLIPRGIIRLLEADDHAKGNLALPPDSAASPQVRQMPGVGQGSARRLRRTVSAASRPADRSRSPAGSLDVPGDQWPGRSQLPRRCDAAAVRATALPGSRWLSACIMVGTGGSRAPSWPVEAGMTETGGTTPLPGAAPGSAVLRYAAFTSMLYGRQTSRDANPIALRSAQPDSLSMTAAGWRSSCSV